MRNQVSHSVCLLSPFPSLDLFIYLLIYFSSLTEKHWHDFLFRVTFSLDHMRRINMAKMAEKSNKGGTKSVIKVQLVCSKSSVTLATDWR